MAAFARTRRGDGRQPRVRCGRTSQSSDDTPSHTCQLNCDDPSAYRTTSASLQSGTSDAAPNTLTRDRRTRAGCAAPCRKVRGRERHCARTDAWWQAARRISSLGRLGRLVSVGAAARFVASSATRDNHRMTLALVSPTRHRVPDLVGWHRDRGRAGVGLCRFERRRLRRSRHEWPGARRDAPADRAHP
jgi:hypothetical protein